MSNKPKILMIGPDINSLGGISSVISMYNVYSLNVVIMSTYRGGNILIKLFVYFLFLINYFFVLTFGKNIRLVHIHTASKGSFFRKYIAFNIAKIFHKKVILNIHPIAFVSFYANSNNFIKKIITNTLNKSDLILVLSETIKSKVTSICQNPNVRILHNPVKIEELNHIESDVVRILFLGKLCKEKGIYDIIEAAKHVKNPAVEINLYGDGDINEFEKLITENNLQNRVKLMGWISGSQKDEVLQNSDIFILPSYSEGLPMSILEAMAVGLPIISTPVGGIPEAVLDGVNGFLIQPGDSIGLAEKIDLLAGDSSLRGQMGLQGYNLAKQKFDIKIITRQLQEIYDEMLK